METYPLSGQFVVRRFAAYILKHNKKMRQEKWLSYRILVQMMGLDKILFRKILMLCSALACYKQDEIILNFSVASFTLANLSG